MSVCLCLHVVSLSGQPQPPARSPSHPPNLVHPIPPVLEVELKVITTSCSEHWSAIKIRCLDWGWKRVAVERSLPLSSWKPEELSKAGYITPLAFKDLKQGRTSDAGFTKAGGVSLYWTAVKASAESHSSWLLLLEEDVALSAEFAAVIASQVTQTVGETPDVVVYNPGRVDNASQELVNRNPRLSLATALATSEYHLPAGRLPLSLFPSCSLGAKLIQSSGQDTGSHVAELMRGKYSFFYGTHAVLWSPCGRARLKALLGSSPAEVQIDAALSRLSNSGQLRMLLYRAQSVARQVRSGNASLLQSG